MGNKWLRLQCRVRGGIRRKQDCDSGVTRLEGPLLLMKPALGFVQHHLGLGLRFSFHVLRPTRCLNPPPSVLGGLWGIRNYWMAGSPWMMIRLRVITFKYSSLTFPLNLFHSPWSSVLYQKYWQEVENGAPSGAGGWIHQKEPHTPGWWSGPQSRPWGAELRWVSVTAWQSTFEQKVIYTTVPGSSGHYEQTLFLLCHSIFPLHIS